MDDGQIHFHHSTILETHHFNLKNLFFLGSLVCLGYFSFFLQHRPNRFPRDYSEVLVLTKLVPVICDVMCPF